MALKEIPVEDLALLRWVRLKPCLACGRKPSDAHHVTTRGAGGEDVENNLMPLCRIHHTEWHKSGPGRMVEKYVHVRNWLTLHERADIFSKIEQSKRRIL